MKICIYGAGAIGGLIGARLANASPSNHVSAIARGATLASLRLHGWRLRTAQSPQSVTRSRVASVAEDAYELGVQDLVVIAVKAPALAGVARAIAPLIGADTVVLPAMNGVPWWFMQGQGEPGGKLSQPLASVDPDGAISSAIPFATVVGCVVHASASTPEPGLVEHRMGNGIVVGEPRGGMSDRTVLIGSVLRHAGFDVTVTAEIRQAIWYKLWGNLTMNPISAITGATIDRILGDPLLLSFCSTAMREASAVGALIGCAIDETPEDRHNVTRRLGAFKSSMLQDVDAGRTIELDAIVTAVHELAGRLQVPTPAIDTLLGMTRLFGRVRGLYPEHL